MDDPQQIFLTSILDIPSELFCVHTMPLLGFFYYNEPRGGYSPAYLNVGLEVEVLL